MADPEQYFRNQLDRVAEEQGYENPIITVSQLPNEGANFTSFLFEATISAEGKDDLNLFGKVAAIGEEMRSLAPLKIFEVEGHFYEHLLATYKKIEEDHNLAKEDRLVAPAFYGSHSTLYEETIILENLKSRGFKTLDRFEVFTWDYAAAAVRELAKLHALSFAFQKEYPEVYAKAAEKLKFDSKMIDSMAPVMKGIMEIALVVGGQQNRPKFDEFVRSLMRSKESIVKYFTSTTVLKHGDYRASNLMHKIDEDGKMVIMPLDYQAIQPGDPVTDLLYLIFTGTDAAFRRDHWTELLEFYYEQLVGAMIRLDIDPELTYSRKDFDSSLEEMLPYGLVVALTVLSLVVVETPPAVGGDSQLSDFYNMKAGDVYKQRLSGIIGDYIQWGIL